MAEIPQLEAVLDDHGSSWWPSFSALFEVATTGVLSVKITVNSSKNESLKMVIEALMGKSLPCSENEALL